MNNKAYNDIVQEAKYFIFSRMKEEKLDSVNIYSLLNSFGVQDSDYKMYIEICYDDYSRNIDKPFIENFKIAWNMLTAMDLNDMLIIEKLIINSNKLINNNKIYNMAIKDAMIFNKIMKDDKHER